MKVIKVKDYAAMSNVASDIVLDLIRQNPHAVLGLATGSTPIGLYQNLIAANKAGEVSFKSVKTYNLDEYCEIPRDHPESYFTFMNKTLFDHIDIDPANTHVPVATGKPLATLCAEYNALLARTKIDLQILGIGENGHIGFNEPGTPFDSVTQVTPLTASTREANKRFFGGDLTQVPTSSITMGIANILAAKKIVLLASGAAKAAAIAAVVNGPVTEAVPASVLRRHKDVVLIIDEAAASKL